MSVFRLWKRPFSSTQRAVPIEALRNLIIIAHIDSGKSTLSDRFLQVTGTVSEKELQECSQFLDSNPIERERQITIKARAARMMWRNHAITLIDCPGHHDFSRQVSRSAWAVEGALFLVDATRGVQAQTLSSVELALESGLELVPVINKVDLPTANIPRAREQIKYLVGMDASDAILTSAKCGTGIEAALDAVIERLPPPNGSHEAPLQALVFDSYFDAYRGVVLFIRIVNGIMQRGDTIISMATSSNMSTQMPPTFTVDNIGFLTPNEERSEVLHPGDIGFVTATIRHIGDIPVGDTITHAGSIAATEPLLGYEDIKPLVYCGLFPTANAEFATLRSALDKLQLQDGSIWYEPEKSGALGSGFRCGFLGLLHMSVTQERLEKEFGLDLICSSPSVSYKILPDNEQTWRWVSSPADVPRGRVKFEEQIARVEVICQQEHVGSMMELAVSRRGEIEDQKSLGLERVKLVFRVPLIELVTDFHDAVKSRSSGFASINYELAGVRPSNLVRLDVHVAGEPVEGLSSIVHADIAQSEGRAIVERLKEVIPRQMFKVVIQAVIGSKIIASAHIRPFRKDVTAKCYGGDASRKKKLLKKQAEGKKRMRTVGNVVIPQEAFFSIVKRANS